MSQPGIDPSPAELLRRAREKAGFNQKELAALAGVSQSVVSRVEGGKVLPGLAFFSRLLECLDLQLVLGTAPLWKSIDEVIESAPDRSVDEVFQDLEYEIGFGGFHLQRIEESLTEIAHAYCGLTAAALLGAPVPVEDCELMIEDDPALLDAFDLWLQQNSAKRWNDRLQMWHFDPVDPRLHGPMRWRTPELGVISLRAVEQCPPLTSVVYRGLELPVVGMAHIEVTDPAAERVLARMRQRLASPS